MENWKRTIILFLTSQTISLFGSALVQYAIMWYVTLETKSGMIMTLYILFGFIPTFILSPFAGVWVDQFNRKKLIALSDSVIAVTTLILAITFMMGYQEMWLLFLAVAIRACGAAIQVPAVSAILPQMVPEDELVRVNGINGSIQAATMLIAPIASASLLTFANLQSIFFIDVVTAAIGVGTLLAFIHVKTHEKATQEKLRYIDDLKQGFHYISNQKYLKPFFLFFAIIFFLVAPIAFLTPLQTVRSFGDEVWRLTAIELAFMGGMVLGGGLIALWAGFRNRIKTMLGACFIIALGTVALGLVPNFVLYLVFMSISGLVMPYFNTPSMTMLQERVDPNYLGRVFGIFSMISSSMMPIGMLVFGPIADIVKIEWLLILTGTLMFILGMIFIRNKAFIEAGEPIKKNDVVEEKG
ncbi:MFS transporter [Kurthia huakuii]|uniref:MFS transporter n=1 Tax=Kurthia huakuii TaxID=1421019 RepID=UPI0004AD7CEC|nr:MFS transporter [Kurthia huakuii]MBM7699806.1 DHA3 family macrolide efflux protein-like MFS transporter [Kurthia huakuii]